MSDAFERQLSEYVDGVLTHEEADAVKAHLATCASCAQTVAELRKVVARARELGERLPPQDLWPGIAARLSEAEPSAPAVGRQSTPTDLGWRRRRLALSIPQLAAAAVVLMAVSAGGMALLDGARPGPGGEAAADPEAGPAPIASLTTAGKSDADVFGRAIAELQEAIFYGEGSLDSLTIRKLVANLETIDRAIEEARRALESDDSDPYLRHHLAEARRYKVRFLRQTAALVAAQT
jgi:hypothetical protein